MDTSALDFPLPAGRIALHPAAERAGSRLLVVDCGSGGLDHRSFRDLPGLLHPGDLLVLNDTKVVPARFVARKESGGRVEGFWLKEREKGRALLMLSGGRLRPGVRLLLEGGGALRLLEKKAPGRWLVEAEEGSGWLDLLARAGRTPLPPYILRGRRQAGEETDSGEDRGRYQTIWARKPGSVAAPTASLHFDEAALAALEERGVRTAWITLHVGEGTFLPITADRLEEHPMHAEAFHVPAGTLSALHRTRARGGRVVAAGTTACRVLEHLARTGHGPEAESRAGEVAGETRLFLTPGAPFLWTDALLTNFHLPRSTLLALVAAFAGDKGAPDGLALIKGAYAEAIARDYRFFSYGDAMFLSAATP
ncbi:MAG: tRNA preQ1(34) S-adenosylmethionine ribosyltransferase-isomerase QueA [Planctomycetota bacterium]